MKIGFNQKGNIAQDVTIQKKSMIFQQNRCLDKDFVDDLFLIIFE